jgi:hypothetical protein
MLRKVKLLHCIYLAKTYILLTTDSQIHDIVAVPFILKGTIRQKHIGRLLSTGPRKLITEITHSLRFVFDYLQRYAADD